MTDAMTRPDVQALREMLNEWQPSRYGYATDAAVYLNDKCYRGQDIATILAALPALLDRLERAEARGGEAQETPHSAGDVWEKTERVTVSDVDPRTGIMRLDFGKMGDRWWSVRGLVDAGWRRISRAALDDEAPR